MTAAEFASCVGVSEGVVDGWVKRGYVPSQKIGRHRLVNIALLADCLVKSDSISERMSNESTPTVKAASSEGPSEKQLDLFNKMPRNKRRNLKKKHGSIDAAAMSVGV